MSRRLNALRKAQEPIDRHGDWRRNLDNTEGEHLAGEIMTLVFCLACVALVYAAATGKLDTQAARLFAWLGV